jgi:hypothetical protein
MARERRTIYFTSDGWHDGDAQTGGDIFDDLYLHAYFNRFQDGESIYNKGFGHPLSTHVFVFNDLEAGFAL